MTRVAAAITVSILAPAPALAEEQLGASYVIASASEDPRSAGHSGVALTATTWSGPLGGALELGHQTWSCDSRMWWARAGVRVALLRGAWVCNNRGRCLDGRLWIDGGVARELWTVDPAAGDATRHARTSGHAGVGIDLQLFGRTALAVFLRAQHTATEMQTDGPYETSLVFGSSILFDVD